MSIQFVTGNEGKVREAREYLSERVEQVEYDYLEIQSADLEAIAIHGARESFEALDGAGVLVGDAGLFIDALDGFPGPYSAYVESTLGIERVWDLCQNLEARQAQFRTVLAFADETGVETFEGSVAGQIVAPRGTGGFGYDPIFEHEGQTMAEMDTAAKNDISHRGRALAAFAEWYESSS